MSHAIKKAKSLLVQNEAVERAKSLIRRERADWTDSLIVRNKKDEPSILPVKKETVEQPHESKLMICTEVLCTLVSSGSLTLTELCHKLKISKSSMEPLLRLLWNRGLVEEEKVGSAEVKYVVTERGMNVLKVIGPLVKEAHKFRINSFEAVSTALLGAGIP